MMFVSKADLTKMAVETNTGFAAVYEELRELREELKLVKELAGVAKKAGSTSKKESQENT
jgi:hypothetical protein